MAVASEHDTQALLRMAIGPACHELRSPLAVVYGFARMLEHGESLDDAAREKYVGQIVRGAERLDSMLDDLSKIGRIAAGRTPPHVEHVSLRSIVDDLCATSTLDGRLHVEPGDDVTIKADPAWLTESLQATVDGLCFEDGAPRTASTCACRGDTSRTRCTSTSSPTPRSRWWTSSRRSRTSGSRSLGCVLSRWVARSMAAATGSSSSFLGPDRGPARANVTDLSQSRD